MRAALLLLVLTAALVGAPAASALGDVTPPESAATPPAFASGASFDIPYTASDDAGGSGLAHVDLYVKAPGDLAFSMFPVDTDATPDSPVFTYTPTAGDGQYAFYTVAVDNDGNSEAPPLTADGATTVDSTAPSSTASAPATSKAGPIPITYSVDDGSGSGVASVELWAKGPGDSGYSLADSDATPDSPSFSYDPTSGDGTYSFYTVAVDAVGNREDAPTQADTQTALDSTAPSSTASAPASSAGGSIPITYSAADGLGSGVASVELWARAPGDSDYSLAATDTTPASPSFSYNVAAGDGTYSFYTVAVDTLGNREASPTQPDAQTTVDSTAPSSNATAPATIKAGPIAITYSADDGAGSGLASVELWAKAPGDSGYTRATTDTTPDSPSFSYSPTGGDGTYSFYTVAVDALGNREAAPTQPDAQTSLDSTSPSSSATAPATSRGGAIPITYTSADGAGSGVATVELWAKAPGDSGYSLDATDTTPASPSFSYNPTAGDGDYSFYTVAVDTLGNREAAPTQPDAQTAVDSTAPSSTASAPVTTKSGPIAITYTAADGAGSGVASVELWARAPGDSDYSLAATDTTPASPSFSYNVTAGDGTYSFYTVAVDTLGNREAAPSQPDAQTTVDSTAPSSNASAPTISLAAPIPITYTADDGSGSGVASVELWAKAPGDSGYSLAATDNTPASPSFSYNPTAGDGSYSFYTVAVDAAGNREAAPAQPDARTTVDSTAPSSTASAPSTSAAAPIAITYTATDGSGSGVASVELWAKAPGDSGYSRADTDNTPASPSFSYSPTGGDGNYSFYTVAVDALGNREAAPAQPDAQTKVDSAAPSSSATAPATTKAGPITITYSANDGAGVGIASVELWAKAPGDSAYSRADTDATPASPSFSYNPTAGDGTYSFYTVAVDTLGNREAAPTQPDAQTTLDSTAPSSSASAPATSAGGPISITYSATDSGGLGVATVELWAKRPGDSGYNLAATDNTPASPSFSYSPAAADGTYSFYTVAVDTLGNRETSPAAADAQTLVDTRAPTSTASAPAVVGSGSIPITYSADDGAGSGVASVELWAKQPGESDYSRAATDNTPASASFSYEPTAGEGIYSFYTVAVDALGNREAVPSQPDDQTTVDSTAPSSNASAPALSATGPIPVTYDATGSDVASVELWAKGPGDSDYSLADTDTTPDSPSFSYDPPAGDGTYSFYTVAVDSADNREPSPTGPDAQTVRDMAAPTSTASAPADSATGSIPITYSAGDGAGSGVGRVELWAEAPGDTSYTLAATDESPGTPSFDYTPAAGDGTYSFYTVAIDTAGNREPTPGTADARTKRTTPAPPVDNSSSATLVAQLPADQSPATAATTSAPSLPLVAAVSLVAKQTLRTAVAHGFRLRMYAYRPVELTVQARLTRRSAKRLGLLRHPLVAQRKFTFAKPGVYEVSLRLLPRAAKRLRKARSAKFQLKTVLTGSGGSSTSTAPLTLRR